MKGAKALEEVALQVKVAPANGARQHGSCGFQREGAVVLESAVGS